jgi:hypothetical protein
MAFIGSDLPEPLEFLDLEHQHSIRLEITQYEMGTALIHPTHVTPRAIRIYMDQNGLKDPPAAGTPISIRVPVLRVTGRRLDAPSPLRYWDISSKTLQADLLPRLTAAAPGSLTVTLIANGVKPTKRYSVEVGA